MGAGLLGLELRFSFASDPCGGIVGDHCVVVCIVGVFQPVECVSIAAPVGRIAVDEPRKAVLGSSETEALEELNDSPAEALYVAICRGSGDRFEPIQSFCKGHSNLIWRRHVMGSRRC